MLKSPRQMAPTSDDLYGYRRRQVLRLQEVPINNTAQVYGSPIGGAILLTALLTIAVLVWSISTSDTAHYNGRRRFGTLQLMILVASGCSTLFLVFYAFAFHQTEFYTVENIAPMGNDASSVVPRIPAITIAAGLFGGVLFIAFTVLRYRGHVQADERLAIEHREAKLKTAEHFSERFSQAAEMLGSERSATRIGGVYALAALADEWSENRQQCVDLLCAYLRTPMQCREANAKGVHEEIPSPPQVPREMLPRPEQTPLRFPHVIDPYRESRAKTAHLYATSSRGEELEVRRAILSSIARGTRRPLDDPNSWSRMSFDLSRCYLESVDFSECHFLKKIDFNQSVFGGTTNMRKAHFAMNAQFDGCLFVGRAWFSRAIFEGHAWFRAAEFCKEVRFGGTSFLAGMLFSYAHFKQRPHLRDNRLGGAASSDLTEIPIASWLHVTFVEEFSACPDVDGLTVWKQFSRVKAGYRVICEVNHADRPGIAPVEHLT